MQRTSYSNRIRHTPMLSTLDWLWQVCTLQNTIPPGLNGVEERHIKADITTTCHSMCAFRQASIFPFLSSYKLETLWSPCISSSSSPFLCSGAIKQSLSFCSSPLTTLTITLSERHQLFQGAQKKTKTGAIHLRSMPSFSLLSFFAFPYLPLASSLSPWLFSFTHTHKLSLSLSVCPILSPPLRWWSVMPCFETVLFFPFKETKMKTTRKARGRGYSWQGKVWTPSLPPWAYLTPVRYHREKERKS